MSYAKAIAALVTPLIIAPLAFLGIGAETTVGTAIEVLIVALATAVSVYWVPNKQ